MTFHDSWLGRFFVVTCYGAGKKGEPTLDPQSITLNRMYIAPAEGQGPTFCIVNRYFFFEFA